MDDLLPVGSSIVLKNNKEYLIIGYSPLGVNDKEQYDYVCTKTVGLTRNEKEIIKDIDYFYINKKDIKRVKYIGFNDKEFDLFISFLNSVNSEIKKIKEDGTTITEEVLKNIVEQSMNKIKNKGSGTGEK